MSRQLPTGAQFLAGLMQSISLEAAAAFDLIAEKDATIAERDATIKDLREKLEAVDTRE